MSVNKATITIAIMVCAMVLLSGCTSDSDDKYIALFNLEVDPPKIDQGKTDWGHTATYTFNLTRNNITRVEFSLTWYDDSGDGCEDIFEMTVISASPSAVYQPTQTVQGLSPLEVTAVVNQEPGSKSGNDKDELEDYLSNKVSSKGVGEWEVSITCVNVQHDCPDPKAEDKGNSWALTVAVYYYKGVVEENL
jgi:hypothetical protein